MLLATEQLPGAVDGPVAEGAQAGHAEGGRGGGEHVLLEGADAEVGFGADGAGLGAARGGGAGFFGGCFGGDAGEEGGGG